MGSWSGAANNTQMSLRKNKIPMDGIMAVVALVYNIFSKIHVTIMNIYQTQNTSNMQ